METCTTCGRPAEPGTTLCVHCGAPTDTDPAPLRVQVTYEGRGPVDQTLDTPLPDDRRLTAVERIFAADWRPAALVAVPTVLVGFALGLVASSYLLWTDVRSSDPFGLGHSAGGFVQVGIGTIAMAFGSPLFTTSSGEGGSSSAAGVAPLTISVLVLLAFALLLRAHAPAGGTFARIAAAVRASLLTAGGLAALSVGADTTARFDQQRLHLTASPTRVFGWSLLAFTVVGALAAVRRRDLVAETPTAPPWLRRAVDEWWLPAQGAIVAMVTAIVLGWVAAIVILLVEADGSRLDVLRTMPILLAYLVNIGLDVFQVSMGAALHASFDGANSGSSSLSLFDRHGLSAAYFGLVALPPVAIGAGLVWMRRRPGVTAVALARASYRMTLPAVLLYLAAAIPSRIGISYGGGGGNGAGGAGHLGPQILLGALIVAAWFLVVGFAGGRWLAGRPARPATAAVTTTVEPRRAHGWSAATVTLLAAVVAAAFTGGGVATASDDDKPHVGDFGAFGSLFIFGIAISADGRSTDGGSVTSSGTAEAQPVPAPTFTSPQDSADVTLHLYAFSEENYYAVNGAYTADAAQLDLIGVPASPAVRIVRAGRTTFCLEAVTDDGSGFTFDQADGFVQPGLNC